MNVLSLFDGISCGQVALARADIKVFNYFSSEIDENAIVITNKHFPNTVHLGDIDNYKSWDLPKIDLIIAGFPCTSLSVAARQKESGLVKGESTLFWKMLEVYRFINPKYFLFENVASMKKTDRDIISENIGVEPIKINSNLVSAQNRSRLYWTNIPNINQPKDKGIILDDIIGCKGTYILSYGRSEKGKIARKEFRKKYGYDGGPRDLSYREWVPIKTGKSLTLTSGTQKCFDGNVIRKLTPIECERLQTLDDNYTIGLCKTHRYKAIGNGFTVDVIAHILKELNND